jgi:ankyrin repeat protein
MKKYKIIIISTIISLTSCMETKRNGGNPSTYFTGVEIPIAEAIYSRNAGELKRLLMQSRIDINQPGAAGFTYIEYATRFKDYEMMEILLKNGSNPNVISHTTIRLNGFIANPPIDRLPLLTVCDIKYNIKYMKLLIKYGADINDNRIGLALSAVLYGDQMDKLYYLVEHGANVNVSSPKGMTPVLRAAHLFKFEIANYFLDQGADPFAVDDSGRTSLQSCIQYYIELTEGTPEAIKEVRKLIRRLEPLGITFDFSKAKIKKTDGEKTSEYNRPETPPPASTPPSTSLAPQAQNPQKKKWTTLLDDDDNVIIG